MKKNHFLLLLFILLSVSSWSQNSLSQKKEIDRKVSELLSKMTIEEKIGQMTNIAVTLFESKEKPGNFDMIKMGEAIQKYHVGSLQNIPNSGAPTQSKWNEIITSISKEANKTRLKIPILYGIDAIHGANYTAEGTLFPQQIGIAATFNTEIARKAAEISAYETRASSLTWAFSPDLDLPRNPSWSRLWESFGEDAYLTSQMGVAYVK